MRRAFTLIELIGVLLIICVLVYLFIPVVQKAGEQARRTSCINNQKQLGYSLILWRGDHNELFPQAWGNGRTEGEGFDVEGHEVHDSSLTLARLWDDRYVTSIELFICPNSLDEMRGMVNTGTDGARLNIDGDRGTKDYRFDSHISADCDPSYLIDPRVPDKSDPMRVVLADGPDTTKERADWMKRTGLPASEFPAVLLAHHRRSTPALFYDGHVTALPMDPAGRAGSTMATRRVDDEHIYYDDDIYDDDAFGYAVPRAETPVFTADTKLDCNLGNAWFDGERTVYHAGPLWDRAPEPTRDLREPFDYRMLVVYVAVGIVVFALLLGVVMRWRAKRASTPVELPPRPGDEEE